jgi:hypothetical protein
MQIAEQINDNNATAGRSSATKITLAKRSSMSMDVYIVHSTKLRYYITTYEYVADKDVSR